MQVLSILNADVERAHREDRAHRADNPLCSLLTSMDFDFSFRNLLAKSGIIQIILHFSIDF